MDKCRRKTQLLVLAVLLSVPGALAAMRLLVLMAALSLPGGLATHRAWADTYAQGPDPSMDGTIYHSTGLNLPAPTTRTTIGIGESVSLWINTASWTDMDCMLTPTIGPVPDAIGNKTWSLSAEFNNLNGPSTVDDAASITIQAALLSGDGTGAVGCIVHDSATHQGGCEVIDLGTVSFEIKVPNSVSAIGNTDMYVGLENTNGAYMGQGAQYYLQVLPASVNFANVQVGEVVPVQLFTWPCGSLSIIAREFHGNALTDYTLTSEASTRVNIFFDYCKSVGLPTWRLLPNGQNQPVDKTLDIRQYLFFQDMNENWVTFYDHYQNRKFRGTDFKASSIWDESTERWRGPWDM